MTFGGKARFDVPQSSVELRAKRLSKWLSQSELAILAQVSLSTIARWESGVRLPKRVLRERVLAALDSYQPRDLVTEAWELKQRMRWPHQFCAHLAGMARATWCDVVSARKEGRLTNAVATKLREFVDTYGSYNRGDVPTARTQYRGTRHFATKVTPEIVVQVRLRTDDPLSALAREFGLSTTAVWRVRRGTHSVCAEIGVAS